jgi:hypothetical protein
MSFQVHEFGAAVFCFLVKLDFISSVAVEAQLWNLTSVCIPTVQNAHKRTFEFKKQAGGDVD